MKRIRYRVLLSLLLLCASARADFRAQLPDALLEGQVMAVAYSGFREGQHPDRGEGAVNPSEAEVLEDLRLLVAHGFHLIRVYDSGENSRLILRLIHEYRLPIQVVLGIWLDAEMSNHEGCEWLTEPIPQEELDANKISNAAEVAEGIRLANAYPEIVAAVNVANEALVSWNDHMVPVEQVVAYVRQVRDAIEQPVSTAENYVWWIEDGAELAKEVDFLGVHTYPVWEGKDIDEGLGFTIENLAAVQAAHPDLPIVVMEAGWATTASEFGSRAGEPQQTRYLRELWDWAEANKVTIFFFAAFDEPWKGNPDNPIGAEKHWGLFFENRQPKEAVSVIRARME